MPKASSALPVPTVLASAAIGLGLVATPLESATAVEVTPTPVESPVPSPTPTTPTTPPVSLWPATVLVGTSALGRPIYAQRQGNPTASKVLLAVGVIHGNEKAGKKIINGVRATQIPADGDVQDDVHRVVVGPPCTSGAGGFQVLEMGGVDVAIDTDADGVG